MHLITCYKMGNQWFLDLPEYLVRGGDAEDLECIGSLSEFLTLLAKEETTISFKIAEQPFAGADFLTLSGTSGGETGGYYHLSSWEGKMVDTELWINKVILSCFKKLPEQIYLRRS